MLQKDRVIVVGAGPVGVTLALLLAQAGVPVLLLEAEDAPVIDYRASTFHPPTLDMLEASGITDGLLSMGLKCPHFQYRDRKEGLMAEFDLGLLANDTRHPYRLACEQFKLVAWVLDRLKQFSNVEIKFGHCLADVAQNHDSVVVTAHTREGDRSYSGRWLVGADGGRSATRKALNINLEGITYPERFVVAGTTADFNEVLPDIANVNYIADADEWVILLKIPDVWRFITPVRDAVSDEVALSDDFMGARLQGFAPRPDGYRIEMRAVYRVHQRVADRFRAGNCFLAGDAAHLNNPIGGMGLNSGLHDAVDLAARLSKVFHRKEDESLLEGYERTRKPIVVNGLLAQTEQNKRAMEARDPEVRRATNAQWRRIAADRELAYQHLLHTSMIAPLRTLAAA